MPTWIYVSPEERIIEGTILSVACIIALTGNIALWVVVLQSKSFRTTSNALLLCLSAADILVSAFNMPITVYTLAVGAWPFDYVTCTIAGFITMVTFIASVMSLGVISINRYILICHPSKFNDIYTARNTGLMIAGTWVLSIILATPPLIGWGVYDYLPGQSFCFCDWKTSVSYTLFMVGTCFGGPCSIMTFSYVKILVVFRASKLRIHMAQATSNVSKQQNPSVKVSIISNNEPSCSTSTDNQRHIIKPKQQTLNSLVLPVNKLNIFHKDNKTKHGNAQHKRREDLRLAWSFLVVIMSFILSWLPFCITMFCSVFSSVPVPRVPDMITLLLGCMNSAYNPIIYGVMNKKFTAAFKKLFCGICLPTVKIRTFSPTVVTSASHVQTNIVS